MVTLLNQDMNFDKYSVLFKDAWKDLVDRGQLKEKDTIAAANGKTQFADLAHYFSYIKDLITIDSRYMMLPIDEDPFEIDANSRTIKVPPKNFAKCSGVQSDNYSEIVTFTIDRYFDYKDLYEAQIAVQWINPEGVEGVSFITLKDLKTYGAENKIRFGWPLTSEMTAAAGNLKFAVRFYTVQENIHDKIEFNYILNTTPAIIPIKDTLCIDWNSPEVIKKQDEDLLFKNYITNSMNPSYGIPTSVRFVKLEENEFPQYGQIDLGTNTLELKAQAITQDLNPLIYVWYRKKGDELTELTNNDKYQIDWEYVLYNPENWPNERPVMTFWLEDASAVPTGGYTAFLGTWPETNPNNLYVQRTRLTFLANNTEDGKDIGGEYFVKAINANEINSVHEFSKSCYILIPAEITTVKDIPDHMFLDEVSKILNFEISEDKYSQREYTIKYKEDNLETNDNSWVEKEKVSFTGSKIDYTLDEGAFGLYQIEVASYLNREDEYNISNICYVSDHPAIPKGQMAVGTETEAYAIVQKVDSDNDGLFDTILIDTTTTATWEVAGSILALDSSKMGRQITLGVEITESSFSKFNKGTLTYSWFRAGVDELTPTLITEDSIDTSITERDVWSLNPDGTLTIQTSDTDNGSVYTYTCIISNTIASETVESEPFIFKVD